MLVSDLLTMEWSDLRRVDQASLWNTMTMLVLGSEAGYTFTRGANKISPPRLPDIRSICVISAF